MFSYRQRYPPPVGKVKKINADGIFGRNELRELCKLIKLFEYRYAEDVIRSVNSNTNEALRWKEYLSQ